MKLLRLKDRLTQLLKMEILRKGGVSLSLKALGALSGYAFLFLVTQYVGAASWGTFTLFLACLHIFSIFSKLGMDLAVVRFISEFNFAERNKDIQNYFLTSWLISITVSTSFSLLIYFFSSVFEPYFDIIENYQEIIIWLCIALPPFAIISINAQSLRGLKIISAFAFYQHLAKFALALCLYVFFFWYNGQWMFYAAIQVFSIGLWILA